MRRENRDGRDRDFGRDDRRDDQRDGHRRDDRRDDRPFRGAARRFSTAATAAVVAPEAGAAVGRRRRGPTSS